MIFKKKNISNRGDYREVVADRFTLQMKGITRILHEVLTRLLPYRDIVGRDDNSTLYLRRFYLKRWGKSHIYLHYFARSDDDKYPHDHPWDFKTLILNKGYHEELKNRVKYWRPPLTRFPKRPAEWAHRVHLTKGPVWTLFTTYGRKREWGFLTDNGWVQWKEYLDGERLEKELASRENVKNGNLNL